MEKGKTRKKRVTQLREQRETNTVLATFHKQSSFTLFTQRFLPPPSTARGGKNRVVASSRSFSRAARARQRVLYARVKEWQALGGNIWPHTRRSRVELEAKWHSKSKKIESVSTLLSFRRAKLTTRKIGLEEEGLRFVARPPFLSFLLLLFPSSRLVCSRCLINVPKSKLDSRRYSRRSYLQTLRTDCSRVWINQPMRDYLQDYFRMDNIVNIEKLISIFKQFSFDSNFFNRDRILSIDIFLSTRKRECTELQFHKIDEFFQVTFLP